MNPTTFWIAAICLAGAVQCFFLACCFGLIHKDRRWTHSLAAVLMLLLGVRIVKSASYVMIGDDMSLLLMNAGFAAHLAAGPLLYLYMRSWLPQSFSRWDSLHFLPAVVVFLAAPWLRLDNFWYLGAYHGLLIASIMYWILAVRVVQKLIQKQVAVFQTNRIWLLSLMAGTGIFFFAYFSNYVLRISPYVLAPLAYSIAVLPVSLAAWHSFRRPEEKDGRKYKNLSLSGEEVEQYKVAILSVISDQQAYLDPDFSLRSLAVRTDLPPHLLSHILNQYLQTNFTSLVNTHRVNAACRLLQQPEQQQYTIAAIAFEAGFRSLSVFNQKFKQLTGLTPSAYRRQYI